MNEKEVLDIFYKTGGILKGHFLLSSGLHSDTYIQCARVLMYPCYVSLFSEIIYKKTKELSPTLIISPALGGLIIGFGVAQKFNLPFIFTEREDKVMKLRRGFEIKNNERVLIIEDVFTTGKSTLEVKKIVDEYKANVVGAASIVKRGDLGFDFPYFYVIELELNIYSQDECPLCVKNIPLVKPGSNKF
jgi:orotate phosphoribosyltransferase